jgi:gluconolactonase
LLVCEGDIRAVTRTGHDGKVEILADRYQGGRLNRPNDIVCHSDGSIFFTDPVMRMPYDQREIPSAATANNVWHSGNVYRVAPDGAISLVASCEYPNGLAFSPDERTLYVANTRFSKYIHAIEVDTAGNMVRRRIRSARLTESRSIV